MRALIVCRDESLVRKISDALSPGLRCDCAKTAKMAVEMARSTRYGLYFIDISVGGVDPCRVIRRFSNEPIIFISDMHSEAEAIAGFDAGADDYLPQPFGMLELCSRVGAILKRCEGSEKPSIRWVDGGAHTVNVDGENVRLTPIEYDILVELARAQGKAVPKSVIIRNVWGMDSYATDDALKVRVNSLRSKIGRDRIETVRGYGYRLASDL